MSHEKPNIRILALGHFHPGNKIPNEFFDRLDIGSDANWVEDRTGIQSRHSVLSEKDIEELKSQTTTLRKLRSEGKVMGIAEMAKSAWEVLRPRISDSLPEIDALICGTSIPDFDIPANACTISSVLDLQCPSFDVNSACSSFVVNLHVARGLIHSGQHKNIAIFNPERYSLRIDYTDRNSAILFGDGCSSALVSSENTEGLEVIDTMVRSDPAKYDTVKIPDGGTFSQIGHAVQKFAITRTIESSKELLERNNLKPEDLSFFAGHQANLRMVESAASRLGIPREKHLFNVDICGNQGSAGAPAVLSMNWNRFKPGDLILVSVVGSGLTWGAALFRKV